MLEKKNSKKQEIKTKDVSYGQMKKSTSEIIYDWG